eukprot:m.11084 g.11084  ORF g.11084 m.11084 type:complete len:50 (+) comp6268_c0_seq1:3-152(+)
MHKLGSLAAPVAEPPVFLWCQVAVLYRSQYRLSKRVCAQPCNLLAGNLH